MGEGLPRETQLCFGAFRKTNTIVPLLMGKRRARLKHGTSLDRIIRIARFHETMMFLANPVSGRPRILGEPENPAVAAHEGMDLVNQ